MPHFETTRRVRHSPDQMFALVADVEEYPRFLPLCQRIHVREEREREGRTLLVADMTVAYKMLKETFTSQVLLKPREHRIEVSYVDGPFRTLNNVWTFEPAPGGGCDVGFVIDYEFKNRALGLVMGSMFDYAFRRFAEAFEKRAEEVYGPAPAAAPAGG